MLRLLKYLVAFGYYSAEEDIKQLLTPLLGVLDGCNDKPVPGGKTVMKVLFVLGLPLPVAVNLVYSVFRSCTVSHTCFCLCHYACAWPMAK